MKQTNDQTETESIEVETEQLRERLAKAGLLATPKPVSYPRPDREAVAAAAKRAARGRSLSSIVIEDRG
jgi:hypothetical protein